MVSAVLLALQVQQAVSEHRRAMVGTLRDDASLAAAEYIRRACTQVGYQGIASDMGRLAAGDPSSLRIAGALLERDGASLLLGGVPLEGERRAWIEERLGRAAAEARTRERAFTTVHDLLDREPRSFAFLVEPIPERKDPKISILGFALRLELLPSFFAKPLARHPSSRSLSRRERSPSATGSSRLRCGILAAPLSGARRRPASREASPYRRRSATLTRAS